MDVDKENFDNWFVNTLKVLQQGEHTGFCILILAFPLLERYLRGKHSCAGNSLSTAAKDDLHPLLGVPKDKTEAFWELYRHGLLHQATFKTNAAKAAGAEISGSGVVVSYENDVFTVDPTEFSNRVIDIISGDFEPYRKGGGSDHKLAIVRHIKAAAPQNFSQKSAGDNQPTPFYPDIATTGTGI